MPPSMSMLTLFYFLLLLGSCLAHTSLPDYCSSTSNARHEAILSDPPQGATLVNVQLLIRHGDRLPTTRCWTSDHVWDCGLSVQIKTISSSTPDQGFILEKRYGHGSYLNSTCSLGQLTQIGHDQHLANGQFFRHRYIEQLSLLPGRLDIRRVGVRSSDMPRTLASVQAFLQGLYPPVQTRGTGYSYLPEDVVFPIDTLDLAKDWLLVDPYNCPYMLQLARDIALTPSYIQLDTHVLGPLKEKYNLALDHPVHAPLSFYTIFDCMSTHICHGFPLPPALEEENIYQSVTEAVQQGSRIIIDHYARSNAFPLVVGNLLGQVRDQFLSVLNGTSANQFFIFSGHDTSVLALLGALDIWDGKWVPYASTLVFELWRSERFLDQAWVRVIYNHQELVIPKCVHLFCDFNLWSQIIQPFIIYDFESACRVEKQ